MDIALETYHAQQLLSRLYGALDERDYATVADCFAQDGVWHRLGKSLQGPQDILATLQQRSATLVTHHLYGNCLFDIVDEARMKVRYLLTVFQVDPGPRADPTAPLHATSPRVGFCDAELVLEDGQWRVAAKQIRTPAFTAGEP